MTNDNETFSPKATRPLAYAGALLCLLLFFHSPGSTAQSPAFIPTLIFEQIHNANRRDTLFQPGEPTTDVAQAEARNALETYVDEYQRSIEDEAQSGNNSSEALREQYDAMGLILQRLGRHEEAVSAFESAMHISRINNGLFTASQIPYVQNIIRSQAALNNISEVNNFEAYLYMLSQRQYANNSNSNDAMLDATLRYADWLVQAHNSGAFQPDNAGYLSPFSMMDAEILNPSNSFVDVETPRGLVRVPVNNYNNIATNAAVTDYMISSVPSAELNPDMMLNETLREAKDLYEQASSELAESNPQQRQKLEQRIANISYLVNEVFSNIPADNNRGALGYNRAIQGSRENPALKRLYSRSASDLEDVTTLLERTPSSTPQEIAQAWLDLGDWHLSFGRHNRAGNAYEEAAAVLNKAGFTADQQKQVLSPEPALLIPVFASHRHTRAFFNIPADAELPFYGYIDVSFDKDQFGKLSNINITGTSLTNNQDETPLAIRRTLLDMLRQGTFRPELNAGEPIEVTGLTARYYYTY